MTAELACPSCGLTRPLEEEKIPKNARWATCPRCGRRFPFPRRAIIEVQSAPCSTSPEPLDERESPQDQGDDSRGFFGLAIAASMAASFSPRRFFGASAINYSIRESFAMGLFMGGAGTMAALFGHSLLSGHTDAFFGIPLDGEATGLAMLVRGLAAAPVYVSLRIIVSSVLIHLCLMIVRGGKKGFGATLRVAALSQFPYLFSFLPFIGSWLGIFWSGVLFLVGLKEIHAISYGRAVAGFFVAFGFLGIFALGAALNIIFGILKTAF